ncbi:MAG: methionyl-tRNA formyltransferase [Candidatus Doudnabacteria bacterium RIFCSPHIGHO2_12_FULL_48_11]|uniref:Methionyl-tRNA formyltransferase n=1 Tax=Candidatus Doudnabacteria bacterium RIFCSPHIGHO2_01_FULL_46_24 TaxID=1817825 RepID=A0A1F5NUV5_9BACT|nr:MAG: methionyl-tRNA formyltransferase [Candidatus Doudnabacteria bacterium RIFCSPHIGHO2_01_FULL_46_24]OGE96095.1 MAG: methionyl-tRNA formyltransferase [Candidatus Doudnabacteria bacterium RIFCSPHIGHO2_12_FULL_48_11]
MAHKIVFAGTTDFGIPTLEILNTKYQILAIVTQPDRPAGRKKALSPSPIKLWAEKNNIPVLQPEELSTITHQLSTLEPGLLLVAAYGQIIPKDILDIPKFGSINIHGSLLPKYRGASPIQAAILRGETETGITLIKMDEKMDHGPVIAQAMMTIDDNDDFITLYKKLSDLSADLVMETLPKWFTGQMRSTEQRHEQATYTKLFAHSDGRVDWATPAVEVDRKVKALNPEPGVWTTLDKKSVKILKTKALPDAKIELPGKIYESGNEMLVKCQLGSLQILYLHPEGRKPMTGRDFLNGLKSRSNAMFI